MAATPERSADPGRWEADVVLSDGGTAHVRPIHPDDADRLTRFHERQSPESIYFRYFSPRPRLSNRDLERLTSVDRVDRMAFVALLGDELVGVARYDRHPARSDAEVAFFTDDSHAGRGMATILLEYLAAAAREAGVSGFTAQVLPQNRKMLSVFKQAGFATRSRFSDGVIEVELAIEPTDEALVLMEERAKQAEARSVARILAPRSIAVVGASRRSGSLGHAVFRRLLDGGFQGPVYPVNPEAGHVAGVRAFPTLLDVPDEIDLVVVVVPADQVLDVVEQCGRKRVQGLVVVSAGFAETGAEGAALERRVVERARAHGMRMVGPNTMGVINTDPTVSMHATFAEVAPLPGRIGVSSQSGTIGAAILDQLRRRGLGVSTFVAAGNKADVSGNDMLQYWEQDAATDLVLLYLESFGNPRNFSRIARRFSGTKPIVAVKAGRADTDHDAPAGWPADATFDALLSQTGVVRVDTLEQMFDVSRVLAHQPLPSGRRVAVLSNFWGPALLAADACVAAGLELSELDEPTSIALTEVLRPGTRLANPLELTSEAGPREYAAAARILLAHPAVDALLAIHAPPLGGRTEAVAEALALVAGDGGSTPLVASFLGAQDAGVFRHEAGSVPVFTFPEAAAHALGRVARYAVWRSEPIGVVPDLAACDPDGASTLAGDRLAATGDDAAGIELSAPDGVALLRSFGIDAVAQQVVASADEAAAVASAIGYPVALKAAGLDRPSKTEAGGVAVDVHGEDELRAAFERMSALHGPAMQPALVQAMAPMGAGGAADVVVALHQDPLLGSVLTLGPAGTGDTTLRIVPLTDVDAARMVGSLPGVGGAAGDALADLLLRVSALADAVPEVAHLRLDPVLVSTSGAHVTDIHAHLLPWDHTPDPRVRRLA